MKVKCPHCMVKGAVDASLLGRLVKCPRCSELFRIPPGQERTVPSVEETEPEGAAVWKDGSDEKKEESADFPHGEGEKPLAVDAEEPPSSAEATESVPEPEDDLADGDKNAAEQDDRTLETGTPEPSEIPPESEDTVDTDDQSDFPDYSKEKVAWDEGPQEEPVENDPDVSEIAGAVEGEKSEPAPVKSDDVLQAELEAMLAETCSVCGRSTGEDGSYSKDEKIFCRDCVLPQSSERAAEQEYVKEEPEPTADSEGAANVNPSYSLDRGFSIGSILKEAWVMTSGVKAAIWGGIGCMFLVLFALGTAAVGLLPLFGAPAGGMIVTWINIALQLVSTLLSITFIAGLLNIAVRRIFGRDFSWRTSLSGFSKIGHVAVAGLLMTLLIVSGLFLLVLPGIYLAVGYSLTLPLILDKGYGPWDAMERSRKIIHRRWWQIFAIYLIMYLIYTVSALPLGIGMIWTIPMFFTLAAVLYRTLTENIEA